MTDLKQLDIRINILGEFEGTLNGTSIVPKAAKPRQVLALLAIRVGNFVPVTTLAEELWGNNEPASVRTTLQTYILQLRRLMSAALGPQDAHLAKEIILTHNNGYSLVAPRTALDAYEFESIAALGYEKTDEQDSLAEASAYLRSASAVWRDRALVDVEQGSALSVEVTRLEEERSRVVQANIDVDLALGRHASVLGPLTELVSRQPFNERIRAQYMIALSRSGRRWQALQEYQRVRELLVNELGVEPSLSVQRIHNQLLRGEPTSTFNELDLDANDIAI